MLPSNPGAGTMQVRPKRGFQMSIIDIREQNKVVGKLNTETCTITEITSPKLAALWDALQRDGFTVNIGAPGGEHTLADKWERVWLGPSKGWMLAVEIGNHGFRWDRPK